MPILSGLDGGHIMGLLLHWLVFTLAIVITAYILPGIKVSGFGAALVTAVVLGIINTIIRPVLIFFTLPINIFTLGLFTLVINALLILLTAAMVPGFNVAGFWWAVLFSIILSVINAILNAIFF